jgi:hypothetical protein
MTLLVPYIDDEISRPPRRLASQFHSPFLAAQMRSSSDPPQAHRAPREHGSGVVVGSSARPAEYDTSDRLPLPHIVCQL